MPFARGHKARGPDFSGRAANGVESRASSFDGETVGTKGRALMDTVQGGYDRDLTRLETLAASACIVLPTLVGAWATA